MTLFALGGAEHWLLAAAAAILTGTLLMRARRRMRRGRASSAAVVAAPRPAADRIGLGPDAPPEIARWEVAMHQTTRDLSAVLDSKMRSLEALVAEADRAAGRLEAALAAADLGARPGWSAGGSGSPAASRPAPAAGLSPAKRDEAQMLADYGFPPDAIANRLGIARGELEAVLSLFSSPRE